MEQPPITRALMHKYIDSIASVAQSSFFSSPQFDRIVQDINQLKYWKPGTGTRYLFFEDIKEHAELIDEARSISGSDKLFNKLGIFTNEGAYYQFLATIWLSRHLQVDDVELNNRPFYTDILCTVGGDRVHFHVKNIEEEKRLDRAEDAVSVIDYVFMEKASRQRDDKRLAVHTISGVPPYKVPQRYWIDWAKSLEVKPQTQTIAFEPSEETGNHDKVTLNIKLDWRPWNSTHVSPTAEINNALRFSAEYNALADKIKASKPESGETHILIALTWDEYDWKELNQELIGEPAGAIVVERFGYEFVRSPILLPNKKALAKSLETAIPVTYKLI